MKFPALLIALASMFVGATAHADDCLTLPPDVNDNRLFVDRVITSLEAFRRGEVKNRSIGKAKDGAEFILSLKLAQQDFSCASKQLDGFEKSSNAGVQTAVQGFQGTASMLSSLNDSAKEDFVAALNGQLAKMPEGDRASHVATMQMQGRDAWQQLVSAATATALSQFEFDPAGSNHRRQRLTSEQRAALAKRLRVAFPSVRTKESPSSTKVDAAAGILYDFLNDKKWRSHDQPFN